MSLFKEIKCDNHLLDIINNDMKLNADCYFPSSHWEHVNHKIGTHDSSHTLADSLADFVGSEGSKPITGKDKERYLRLLERIDKLNLRLKLNSSSCLAEYGSVMDINLIRIFTSISDLNTTIICEVGGGYGRLAEIFFQAYGRSVKYILIDSVPISLMYSFLYLSIACPEARVGLYYNDLFNLDDYDIFIIPTWHFVRLNSISYDIVINIESMQEMTGTEVTRFIDLFDNIVKKDGIIYLSNSRDYIYKGEWQFPQHWKCLFRYNTPRSWTKRHPTEIFQKSSGCYIELYKLLEFYSEIEILEMIYTNEQYISNTDLKRQLKNANVKIEKRNRKLDELKHKIADQSTRLNELEKLLENAYKEISLKKEQINKMDQHPTKTLNL